MKLTIHPLFFVFGLYFALTGKVFLFLTFALTAVVHEFGHASCAAKLGYKINNISLMPYGAVANGAIEGLSYKDEIEVALAGPLINLAISLFFAALWWLVPELYAVTDTVAFANLSVAAINFIPAYPLDGGRVLSATLSLYMKRKTAMKIVRAVGIILSLVLFALFIITAFSEINFSLGFFSAFVFIGAIGKTKENAYVKAFSGRSLSSVTGVKEIKSLAVSGNVTLKQLMSFTDGKNFFRLCVCDKKNGRVINLDEKQTEKLLESYRLYEKISDIIGSKSSDNV